MAVISSLMNASRHEEKPSQMINRLEIHHSRKLCKSRGDRNLVRPPHDFPMIYNITINND